MAYNCTTTHKKTKIRLVNDSWSCNRFNHDTLHEMTNSITTGLDWKRIGNTLDWKRFRISATFWGVCRLAASDTAQWCKCGSRVAINTKKARSSSSRNRINRKMASQANVWGVWKKHDFHVFVKTGLVYDCQKSWHFLCRKMTVGYLQVQTPLACVHFIQTAKIMYGNSSQSLLLLMPNQKKPYLFWFGGDQTICHHVAVADFT